MSEFLRIVGSTLLLAEFLSAVLNVIDRMINQGRPKHILLKHIIFINIINMILWLQIL